MIFRTGGPRFTPHYNCCSDCKFRGNFPEISYPMKNADYSYIVIIVAGIPGMYQLGERSGRVVVSLSMGTCRGYTAACVENESIRTTDSAPWSNSAAGCGLVAGGRPLKRRAQTAASPPRYRYHSHLDSVVTFSTASETSNASHAVTCRHLQASVFMVRSRRSMTMAKETIGNNFEKAILSCGAVLGWIGYSGGSTLVLLVSGTGLVTLGSCVPRACWCMLV